MAYFNASLPLRASLAKSLVGSFTKETISVWRFSSTSPVINGGWMFVTINTSRLAFSSSSYLLLHSFQQSYKTCLLGDHTTGGHKVVFPLLLIQLQGVLTGVEARTFGITHRLSVFLFFFAELFFTAQKHLIPVFGGLAVFLDIRIITNAYGIIISVFFVGVQKLMCIKNIIFIIQKIQVTARSTSSRWNIRKSTVMMALVIKQNKFEYIFVLT